MLQVLRVSDGCPKQHRTQQVLTRRGLPPTIKTSTAGGLYVGDEHGPIGQIARLEPPNEFVIRASDRVERVTCQPSI